MDYHYLISWPNIFATTGNGKPTFVFHCLTLFLFHRISTATKQVIDSRNFQVLKRLLLSVCNSPAPGIALFIYSTSTVLIPHEKFTGSILICSLLAVASFTPYVACAIIVSSRLSRRCTFNLPVFPCVVLDSHIMYFVLVSHVPVSVSLCPSPATTCIFCYIKHTSFVIGRPSSSIECSGSIVIYNRIK